MKRLMIMNFSLKDSVHLVQTYKWHLTSLFLVLGFLTFIVYERVMPHGFFSGLQNDLKILESEHEPTFYDLDGNPVSLLAFKGKPLVMNAWATWVPFSKDELSLLARAQEQYGDRVTFLAINRMEESARVRAYSEQFAIPRTLMILIDPTDAFYERIHGYGMPETIFYQADGTILDHVRGVLTKDALDEYLRKLVEA
jgi:thiol-disulfide isomerase/thioredoxin